MLGVQCCGGRVFISSDDFATSVLVAGGGGGVGGISRFLLLQKWSQ